VMAMKPQFLWRSGRDVFIMAGETEFAT
jgi:hypothetical protein